MFDTDIKSLCLNDSSQCDYNGYQILKPQVIQLFERELPQSASLRYNNIKYEKESIFYHWNFAVWRCFEEYSKSP